MKLALRPDGTVVYLDSPHGPYHVCPKEVDEYGAFDLDELLLYAKGHPDDVLPEGSEFHDGYWYIPEPEPIGTHDRVNGEWVSNQSKVERWNVNQLIEEINILEQYLHDTDWYVIRLNDPSDGRAIPEDVLLKRTKARNRISEIRLTI
jgi:hypothetical protein